MSDENKEVTFSKEKAIEWAKENPLMALVIFGAFMIFVGITFKAGITTGIIVVGIMAIIAAFFKMMIDL